MAEEKKAAAPPPPPPPPPPPAAKAVAPVATERVAGNTTIKVWDSDSGKGLEIVRMHDSGAVIEAWVKTK